MIPIKTKKEIKIMRQGAEILASVMRKTLKKAKPGITTAELDQCVEKLIEEKGGVPSFKMVPKYHWATCMCVNGCVVHGVPNRYQLKEDDILGVDIGVFFKGFHTDMARTLCVRNQNTSFAHRLKTPRAAGIAFGDARPRCPKDSSDGGGIAVNFTSEETLWDTIRGGYQESAKLVEITRFLKTGELALKKAIDQARAGNHVGHISEVIQNTVEEAGYSVVKTLVGHGVGKKLHEEPQVPGFLAVPLNKTPLLKKGMTIAIEIIYNQGEEGTFLKKGDGWTILTKDGKLSALFEDTVAITERGPIVLTKLA